MKLLNAYSREKSTYFFINFLLIAIATFDAYAHELARVSVNKTQAGIGEPVQIAIDFRPKANVKECGLNVDFGDGTSDYVHVQGSNPSGTIQHIYQRAGIAVIRIEGKNRLRGLKSIFACTGGAKTVALTVSRESDNARRAAALAEKQALVNRTLAAEAEAERQRRLAEQANQRARAAANRSTRENADQRGSAQQPAASAAESAPKPKAEQSKPKSTLDL